MRLEDKNLVYKLIRVEKQLSTKEGPFDLFALVLREELSDRWDLLIAADWIENNFDKSLRLISRELTKKLSSQQLSAISKVVLLSVFDPRVKSVQKAIQVEHLDTELANVDFFGFFVDHGYLITAKRRIDDRLQELIWNILVEDLNNNKKAISGDEIFQKVSTQRKKVTRTAINKVLDHFIDMGYIRASFKKGDVGSPSVPGAMVITSVNSSSPPSSIALTL